MAESADIVRADRELEQGILATLMNKIGQRKFNAWFRHGATLKLEDGHIRILVPNPFVANWIETHFQPAIVEAVGAHIEEPPSVLITVDPELNTRVRNKQRDMQAEMVSKATHGRVRTPSPPATTLRHKLGDFVVGEANRLAYGAAVAVASGNAPFNPLFIHGHCGVGKTHLLQGVCNAANSVHRGGRKLKWRYVTGEQFTNEFIQSVRKKTTAEFRARYRGLDLLAIDDVHFLAAKRATQDEFLHTFNAIEAAGKQVVMASDAHPRLVGDLNEQLTSRFLAGMVVKIDPPDRQMRLEILRRRAKAMKLSVPKDVLEYIALHIRGSVRELEGSLINLAALSALEGGKITLAMATDALADHLARTDSAITLGDIEATVAPYFGVTPADIHSSRRTRTVSVARMIAMYLARRHTRMSFPEIGRFMGKNHSSVVLACQRMDKALEENADLDWTTPAGKRGMPARKLLEVLNEQL